MKSRIAMEGWQDVMELLIAVWLFVAPFALGFIDNSAATLSAYMIAALLILTSQLGIAEQQPWEEWVNLILAVVLMMSPWILDYKALEIATINAVLSGVGLILFAVLSMRHEYSLISQKIQRATTT